MLKLINVIFLQWAFVRLTRCQEKRIEKFDLFEVSFLSDGGCGIGGAGETNKYQWYSLQFWIVPITGWWSDFIYLSKKPIFFKLTRDKRIK